MKNYFLTLGILLIAGVASHHALADSFYLDGTNSTTAPCSVTNPCAEVMITTLGNTATFTVTSLDAGFVFDTFGFNFTGSQTLSLDGTPTGEIVNPGFALNTNRNEDGWGSFPYDFETGENGGSNGSQCTISGGTPSAGCTFSFSVMGSTSSPLTTSEFESAITGGNGSGDFAGHIASSANSGYIGDSAPIPTTTSAVPEPSSLMVMGTGILGVGLMLRRRLAPAKA